MAQSVMQTCSRCGKPLDALAPRGVCVHCVLESGLLPPTDEVESVSARDRASSHHAVGTDEAGAEASSEGPGARPDLAGSGTVLTRFGDYELLEEIARGGMGIVYKARQVSLNRLVAVKMILSGQFASKQEVLRFRVEAEAEANLRHPNIVAIYETGEHRGQHFFSMEYVAGPNLSQLVGNRPLNAQLAARYTLAIARAIHYAHGQNTLHRDLKPSNVLVDADDQPRITDFGLMRRLRGPYGLTVTGQMLGSPNFMPPEQCGMLSSRNNRVEEAHSEKSEIRNPKSEAELAKAKVADGAATNRQSEIVNRKSRAGPWSDVYGIGAILYHLLTARPPFQAETVQDVLLQLRERDPVAPRLLNPSIPRDLETVCLKCLEKEPDQRYATADELADDLDRFLKNEPILARPVGRAERAWRWCRRKPLVAGLVVGLNLVLALGLAGVLWQWRRAETNAAKNLQHLIRRHVATGNRLAEEGNAVASLPWFVEALRLETDPARAEMHRLRLSTALRQSPKPVQIWQHGDEVKDIQLSPDQRWVATASRDKAARVWDLASGQGVTAALAHELPVEEVQFARDGQRLLTVSGQAAPETMTSAGGTAGGTSVAGQGTIGLWQLPTGQKLWERRHPEFVTDAEFSPGGEWIVSACSDGKARLMRTADGAVVHELEHPQAVIEARFSPDGARLVTTCKDLQVRLWDAASGQRLRELDNATLGFNWERPRRVAFSPDGRRVLGSGDERVRVWDTETGGKLFDISASGTVMSAEFSPDDLSIVTADSSETCEIWNATNGVKTASVRVADYYTTAGFDLRAEFSPDSQSILTYGFKGAQFWWPGGRRMRCFIPKAGVLRARLSRDGRYLLLACSDHTARVWDLISTEEGKARMEIPSALLDLKYSRDGGRIVTADVNAELGFWDAANSRPSLDQMPRHPYVSPGWDFLAFSGDQMRVLSPDQNDHVRIYDTQTGQPAGPFLEHGRANQLRAVFASDPDRVVTADQHGTVRLWLATEGKMLREVTNAHRGPIELLDRQPHGNVVATSGHDRTLRFWNDSTLAPAAEPVPLVFRPSGIAYSPDGTRLVIAFWNGAITLLDVVGHREIWHRVLPDIALFPAFSSDGRRVAACCRTDGVVRVWDTRSGAKILDTRYTARPRKSRFSPDGRFLCAGGSDGLRLWDVATGELAAAPFRGAAYSQANGYDFSPDGRTLAVGCVSGARTWDLAVLPCSVPQWQRLAAAFSGQRINAQGELEPLEYAEWLIALNSAKAESSAMFAISDEEALHWHWDRARHGGFAENWHAAIGCLDRLIDRQPADAYWRRRRAIAWLNLGNVAAAAADDPAYAIPARDPRATRQQIDLTPHYNLSIARDGLGSLANDLAELRGGLQEFGGTLFDVRGVVCVGGRCPQGRACSPQISHIRIADKCRALHMVQATFYELDEPGRVGSYRLHYADGETAELPIDYGRDLRNYWILADTTLGTPNASVVWTGHNPVAELEGHSLRLFKRTYPNPRPEVEIESMDFISAMNFPAPFVVAITVE